MKRIVFDVESVGLYGEGFAVGAVVLDDEGKLIASLSYGAPPGRAEDEDGYRADSWRFVHGARDWLKKNLAPDCPCDEDARPSDVRHALMTFVEDHQPAQLWADWAYPVEANFLRACRQDNPARFDAIAPMPLHEVATLMQASGLSDEDVPRLPSELPEHHPLRDARHSARKLLACLVALERAQ